ncbi:hypothetical protein [Streptomyces anthocyanicus]|uniref:Uncharacterized protein n=1 Tax=Streptomyces anthocyanicus TaxID=68174 RepID=A0ABZ1MFD8_9ACTN|nr:hypothetical protein [Streptomyces anthocyanicus]WSB58819.1 hypothetical protein OIE72_00735 [Streptomyces anthocyanicus]WSB65849.1 hypothetical protein OIE72_38710 [Streptomyces anthocyanicus]
MFAAGSADRWSRRRDHFAQFGGGLGHDLSEGGVRLGQPAGHGSPVDRQYHVDDESCLAGLDAAALGRRRMRFM